MLRLKSVDHIGLVVTDMDRSLEFYTERLEFVHDPDVAA